MLKTIVWHMVNQDKRLNCDSMKPYGLQAGSLLPPAGLYSHILHYNPQHFTSTMSPLPPHYTPSITSHITNVSTYHKIPPTHTSPTFHHYHFPTFNSIKHLFTNFDIY